MRPKTPMETAYMPDAFATLQDTARQMLGGLQALPRLRAAVLAGKRPAPPHPSLQIPALAAALAVLVTGVLLVGQFLGPAPTDNIRTFSAGEDAQAALLAQADVPQGGLTVTQGRPVSEFSLLFATGAGANFPLIGWQGQAYRMLKRPAALKQSALGGSLGEIQTFTDEPALAEDAWQGLVSNAVAQGTPVYRVSGISADTAVAAEVDGNLRLFQRFTFAQYGATGDLADVLDIRGGVESLDLSGVGEITDRATVRALVDTLLNSAAYMGEDVPRGKQSLTIRLSDGFSLQMLVSGDTLGACGAWACPDFIQAYEAAAGGE
ncbi:MAG: hypothetical protein LBU67_02065 [Oscillospiraceae bacterium]|jgi:hypothetical protein|nr:hypothetical protein [Oscillospiraceae bacterium]